MSISSRVPSPEEGGGIEIQPAPRPSVVPAKSRPEKRHGALWGSLLVLALVGSAAVYYLNTQRQGKGSDQHVVTVSTAVVGIGDLLATVRVNGTVAAQNFALL